MACYQLWTALYVIASVCVVYKLAYLIRQSAALHGVAATATRLAALFAGTVIVYRMIEAADGRVEIEPSDVGLQLLWCVILYCIISIVGRRKRVW